MGEEVAHDGFLAPLTLVSMDSLPSHQQKWVTFLFSLLPFLGPVTVLGPVGRADAGLTHLSLSSYIPAVVDHRGGMPCMGTFLLHQVPGPPCPSPLMPPPLPHMAPRIPDRVLSPGA